MCTRSRAEQQKRPFSKSADTVVRGDSIERIKTAHPMFRGDSVRRVYAFAIFEEHHVNSGRHLHVIIDDPSRARPLSYIAGDMTNQWVFADCRLFPWSSGRVPGDGRFVNYCLVPTESMRAADPSPTLYNLEIPTQIADASCKSKKPIMRKSATVDDHCSFLDMGRLLSHAISRRGTHAYYRAPFDRLRLHAPKRGKGPPSKFPSQ